MKNTLGILLFTFFVLISCNNKNQETSEIKATFDVKTEIGKINNFLKQYEEPSQNFKILADKPSQVKGKQGTIIFINPNDLVAENGKPLGKNLEIELKELINQQQLAQTNAQTTSNGELLVSGGAYFINITSDGQQLKLKKGKSLSIEFPKISSSEMLLFYGQKDSLGQMNWEQTKQKFVSKPTKKIKPILEIVEMPEEIDTTNLEYIIKFKKKREPTIEEKKAIKEEKRNDELANKVYNAINLTKFGWINCDKFYETPNKTNLQYTFNKNDSIISANAYILFKDINSVMQSEYFSFENIKHNSGFQNIPIGAKIKLIVLSIKNGKTYIYKSDLIIKSNQTIQIALKEMKKEQVNKLFR